VDAPAIRLVSGGGGRVDVPAIRLAILLLMLVLASSVMTYARLPYSSVLLDGALSTSAIHSLCATSHAS
jgi:hypothetical protein